MARHFISITALLLTQHARGQKFYEKTKPGYATKKEAEVHEKNSDCIKHAKKSFTARLKNYPFNMAAQIQLVAFAGNTDAIIDGVLYNFKDSLPGKNDIICYSKLKEAKVLTFAPVDKLTDIFYNYGYRYCKQMADDGVIYMDNVSQCYNPRNAILFLNTAGKAFGFIGICFECDKTKESSDRISLGVLCN